MKNLLIISFVLLISCSTNVKKVYMCGDRECVDKKEADEYFSKTLISEIKVLDNKKKKESNLIELNIIKNNKSDKKTINNTPNKKLIKDKLAQQKKLEKMRIKKERKIALEKAKEEKRLAKLKIKEEKKLKKNKVKEKKKLVKLNKKKPLKKSNKKTVNNNEINILNNTNSEINTICKVISDCDIDKITDNIIKIGQTKSYPKINTR